MDSIVRGAAVYLFLLIVFRAAGKRSLSEATTFDLVLLLMISETTQQAMIDDDHSMTNGFLLILTLVGIDVLFSFLKLKFGAFKKIVESTPLVLISNGEVQAHHMLKARVDMADVLNAARSMHGLSRIDQIKYAILEAGGHISVIPKDLREAA